MSNRMAFMKRWVRRVDGLVNYVSGLGTQRDKARTNEVVESRQLSDEELEVLYYDSAYAGIMVDELAEHATRKGWTVVDGDGKDLTADFDDNWKIQPKFALAASLSRLFGGAALLLVTDDVSPENLPSEPLNTDFPFELQNIVVLDKREFHANEWERDITNPNHGHPRTWMVAPSGDGTAGYGTGVVHHSRLVYLEGVRVTRQRRIENQGFGDSVLRRGLDAIVNKTNIDHARASIVQDFKVDVLQINELAGIATSDQREYFDERMEAIARHKSLINTVLLGPDETYQKTVTSVAGLGELNENASGELTAAFRMPQTRLFGEAPGGFNTDGESQTNNWNSQTSAYQTNTLEPALIELYRVVLAATNGPVSGKMPDTWSIKWSPLEEPTEHQTAALRLLVAQTDKIYIDLGVLDAETVRRSRFTPEGWSMEVILENDDDSGEVDADVLNDVASMLNEASPDTDVQKQALNGAQIASLVTIMQNVNAGLLSLHQGASIISRSFQMSLDEALELIGEPQPPASQESNDDPNDNL